MTIEELKSIVKAEIAEQREIEEICENTTHYYVFLKQNQNGILVQ